MQFISYTSHITSFNSHMWLVVTILDNSPLSSLLKILDSTDLLHKKAFISFISPTSAYLKPQEWDMHRSMALLCKLLKNFKKQILLM